MLGLSSDTTYLVLTQSGMGASHAEVLQMRRLVPGGKSAEYLNVANPSAHGVDPTPAEMTALGYAGALRAARVYLSAPTPRAVWKRCADALVPAMERCAAFVPYDTEEQGEIEAAYQSAVRDGAPAWSAVVGSGDNLVRVDGYAPHMFLLGAGANQLALPMAVQTRLVRGADGVPRPDPTKRRPLVRFLE